MIRPGCSSGQRQWNPANRSEKPYGTLFSPAHANDRLSQAGHDVEGTSTFLGRVSQWIGQLNEEMTSATVLAKVWSLHPSSQFRPPP